MTDLYAILGVKKNAGKATIRAAYRRLAKSAHPDAGGDAEAFARLKLAHDVLMDDDRRAFYNATGSTEQKAEKNEMAPVYQAAINTLCVVLGKVSAPEKVDIVGLMIRHIDETISQMVKMRQDMNIMMDRIKSVRARLIAPESMETDPLRAALESQCSRFEAGFANMELEKATLIKTRAFVEKYGYDWIDDPWGPALNQAMSLATTKQSILFTKI